MLLPIADLKPVLESKPQKVVITTHRNPDGDALGSSFALQNYLVKKGHSVTCICPSEFPDFFAWMDGTVDLVVTDLTEGLAKSTIKNADIIFSLDYNALQRVDTTGNLIKANKTAIKVLIDHHLDPEEFATYQMSDIGASSTCELIYRMIEEFDDLDLLDEKTAEYILTGLITDTGSYRHATNPKVFKIVAHLLEIGVDDKKIQDYIFNSSTEKQIRLLGYCLKDKLEIVEAHNTGIIALDKNDFETYDIQRGDTEGIVNMILRIKKIQIAALITEQKSIVKMSLRSKGDISVQEIASSYFNGGGHKNASGGMSRLSIVDTVRKFKKVLDHHFVEAE